MAMEVCVKIDGSGFGRDGSQWKSVKVCWFVKVGGNIWKLVEAMEVGGNC